MADLTSTFYAFIEMYGGDAASVRMFHAPGRVNLIGEHTDYNGGYVFPASLTFGTAMLIRKRDDRLVRMASLNIPLRREVDAGRLVYDPEDGWTNYPKGVLEVLRKKGFPVSGYDILFAGTIPNGAGLSSSASIEVVTGYGVLSLEGCETDVLQLALLAQEAENAFIGVNCGIMDQFAVAAGKKNHAVLLKCDDLTFDYVPFAAKGHRLIIGNTNKTRGLVESAYNERRSQCERAVRELQAMMPGLKSLGELSPVQLAEAEQVLSSETLRKRVRHVVLENDRVLRSVEVLRKGDLRTFGQLMIESHASLRNLYEVTGPELDAMTEEALKIPGVLGSRMTGAGFGGCTVSLVEEDQAQPFIRQVGAAYEARTGLTPEFYVCDIGDGVQEILA
ncbi:galactokinase [Paenibacillus sp. J31TS4]|uniref:galactokinase n=1 Tax=Paenibacillus sp. J31TS4 TaxID=2807195 RepID=UPI001B1E9BD8|nr:galactokinase [Paenibacillus sp. J31TS4]GIP37863.1 galactokinase [Paenibacillus sp. J31TS4]